MVPPAGLSIFMRDMLVLAGERVMWWLGRCVDEGAVLLTFEVVYPLSRVRVSERPLEVKLRLDHG
jgi:hypothetical protein